MRQLLRRTFHSAAAASLLLFVAVGVLWVRGRSRTDHVSLRIGAATEVELVASKGYLCWCLSHLGHGPRFGSGSLLPPHDVVNPKPRWG